MSANADARRELIAGLRAVANFYEQQPGAYYDGMTVTIAMYAAGRRARAAFAETAAALCEAGVADRFDLGNAAPSHGAGNCEGGCRARHAAIAKNFSAKVRLEIFGPCELSPGDARHLGEKPQKESTCLISLQGRYD
ncbi:MAG TPA: hypothetical protein VHX11_00820 [Acidobacteriaceae bacterium]|jgi:hypothetical protein|nr:hypothetical protein [Acidobacteriaceae bacterium]